MQSAASNDSPALGTPPGSSQPQGPMMTWPMWDPQGTPTQGTQGSPQGPLAPQGPQNTWPPR